MFWKRRRRPSGPPEPPGAVSAFPTIVAEPGPPLGTAPTRQRPHGRIAGSSASGAPLEADWDACDLDGEPIADLAGWARLLAAGRLADVRGAFVLAWREPDGALCLARDALGARTLFYAEVDGELLYGPSPAALVATGRLERRIDHLALARYLSYAYVPGRATLIAGVCELLPGELVRFAGGRLTRARFWDLPSEAAEGDEEALRLALRACLERAVRRRLPAGEAVGATLSGGIDSSLVVALAAALHDAPVHTFSVSFGREYRNELPWSDMVAQACGTRHTVLELPAATVVRHLDEAIAMLPEPIGDPLTVPNALLFREAAAVAGVVLNGEGGDPCFGGPKNAPMLLAELLGHGTAPGAALPYARERAYLAAHQKCYEELDGLLAPDVRAVLADDALAREIAGDLADPRHPSLVDRLMAVNVRFKGAHHILAKVDGLSAPFGVLPRAPLFDRDVVEAAFALPAALKLHGSTEKHLLKEAVRDLVPEPIRARPKSGMLVPVEGWFQGPLLPMARERLLDGLAPWGLFDRAYLEALLAGELGGLRPRRGVKIWLLVTLESWLRTTLGRA